MSAYPPLNTLKPIAKDIWIADGPDIRFYRMPFSTRMTVVRLQNGDVWLHSPIKPTPALIAEIRALGPVTHLIAPNWIHYAFVADWQAHFTQALCWAAPGVAKRAASRGTALRIDHDLGDSAETPWSGQIEQMIVHGSRVHIEAVFFHRVSATLILTDLIENFEPAKLPLWMRWLTRLAGISDPDGQMPRDMRTTFWGHYPLLRRAVIQMIDWAPERIILAHGRWYEKDAVAELRRAFRFVL
ncbi:MAG: DUF4336 domain-containing protein [Rhodobacteraceae bacterium]|nr:DUF4336 domain-containing protein [Paracoccaceae bacterium]